MYKQAAEYIKSRLDCVPETAVILGTGLGGIIDINKDSVLIPYRDIPEFPISTVHKGNLILTDTGGKKVLFMQGRVHFYEGYTMQQLAVPVQALYAAGVKRLIVTNASGGINEDYVPGDIVMITDHIKLDLDSSLRGKNPDELGNRFFDMTQAYTPRLRETALKAAGIAGIELKSGIYAYMGGPQFETPAEIRMLRMMGADLVGMSTVPEVICAAHCGMEVLGLSCVTNMAAGMKNGGLNQSVIDNAEKQLEVRLKNLITEVVKLL